MKTDKLILSDAIERYIEAEGKIYTMKMIIAGLVAVIAVLLALVVALL